MTQKSTTVIVALLLCLLYFWAAYADRDVMKDTKNENVYKEEK